jgi:cytosine/adenosine deaminase-related metal-dependent hydrolase
MPEGGQTLSALRQFICPSFAALTEDDMGAYARHAAAEMIRFGTTLFEEPGRPAAQAADLARRSRTA